MSTDTSNEALTITVIDHVDYAELIAEIQLGDDCIAWVTQESGEFRVEFDSEWIWSTPRKRVSVKLFVDAIARAEARLRLMTKVEDSDAT